MADKLDHKVTYKLTTDPDKHRGSVIADHATQRDAEALAAVMNRWDHIEWARAERDR